MNRAFGPGVAGEHGVDVAAGEIPAGGPLVDAELGGDHGADVGDQRARDERLMVVLCRPVGVAPVQHLQQRAGRFPNFGRCWAE
jgi:hypothetical protein